jgi:hypothetical protein
MNGSEKPKHENMSESADQLGEQGKGGEDEKPLEEKKAEWEENPDLEDPRLISPLQEPDRPASRERIRQESEQKQTPSEENQENC